MFVRRDVTDTLGKTEVMSAHRTSRTSPFPSPSPVMPIVADAQSPILSDDALHLYVTITSANQPEFWQAARSSADAPFPFPTPASMAGPGPALDDYVAGTTMFGTASMPARIEEAEVHADWSIGAFSPVAVEGIGIDGALYPVVTADHTVLYMNALDTTGILEATRTSSTGPFTGTHALIELPALSAPTWISPDDCRLYFTEQQVDDAGTRHASLVMAERPL